MRPYHRVQKLMVVIVQKGAPFHTSCTLYCMVGYRNEFLLRKEHSIAIRSIPWKFQPRRYFRIARRAQRARVLYDGSALEARNDIVYIHERALLKCSCNATN